MCSRPLCRDSPAGNERSLLHSPTCPRGLLALHLKCGEENMEGCSGKREKKKLARFLSVLPANSKETVTLILCAVNPH